MPDSDDKFEGQPVRSVLIDIVESADGTELASLFSQSETLAELPPRQRAQTYMAGAVFLLNSAADALAPEVPREDALDQLLEAVRAGVYSRRRPAQPPGTLADLKEETGAEEEPGEDEEWRRSLAPDE